MFAVNARGVFLGTKYALPVMLAAGAGVIINTVSAAGMIGLKDRAAYCASKGAVIAFTKQVAVQYAGTGVRCNCLCVSGHRRLALGRETGVGGRRSAGGEAIAHRTPADGAARLLDSPEDAKEHVTRYVISNDVSERHLQLETSGGQWSKGKSCETFNPLGPWLATADEVPDPSGLQLRSFVNRAIRQDSNTRDMIFDVFQLVYDLSQVTVLEPGDLINTGTPEGVALSGRFPYLVEGDVVSLDIEGLGAQRQMVRQA